MSLPIETGAAFATVKTINPSPVKQVEIPEGFPVELKAPIEELNSYVENLHELAFKNIRKNFYEAKGIAMPLYVLMYNRLELCAAQLIWGWTKTVAVNDTAASPEKAGPIERRTGATGGHVVKGLRASWTDKKYGILAKKKPSKGCALASTSMFRLKWFDEDPTFAKANDNKKKRDVKLSSLCTLLFHLRNNIAHNKGQASVFDGDRKNDDDEQKRAKREKEAEGKKAQFKKEFDSFPSLSALCDLTMRPSNTPALLSPTIVWCLIELMVAIVSALISDKQEATYNGSSLLTAMCNRKTELTFEVEQTEGPKVCFLGKTFQVSLQDICCMNDVLRDMINQRKTLNVAWSHDYPNGTTRELRATRDCVYPHELHNDHDLVCENNCRQAGGHPHLQGMWVHPDNANYHFHSVSQIHEAFKAAQKAAVEDTAQTLFSMQRAAAYSISLSPVVNTAIACYHSSKKLPQSIFQNLHLQPKTTREQAYDHQKSAGQTRVARERHEYLSRENEETDTLLKINGSRIMSPFKMQSYAIGASIISHRPNQTVNFAFALIATYAAFERQLIELEIAFKEARDAAGASTRNKVEAVVHGGENESPESNKIKRKSSKARTQLPKAFKYGPFQGMSPSDLEKVPSLAKLLRDYMLEQVPKAPRGWEVKGLVIESEEWWNRIFFRYDLYYTLRQVTAHNADDVREELPVMAMVNEGKRFPEFGNFPRNCVASKPDIFTHSDNLDVKLYTRIQSWAKGHRSGDTLHPLKITDDEVKQISKGLALILQTLCICYQFECERNGYELLFFPKFQWQQQRGGPQTLLCGQRRHAGCAHKLFYGAQRLFYDQRRHAGCAHKLSYGGRLQSVVIQAAAAATRRRFQSFHRVERLSSVMPEGRETGCMGISSPFTPSTF